MTTEVVWLNIQALVFAGLILLFSCHPKVVFAHGEDFDGCMKYLAPITQMVWYWSPSVGRYEAQRYFVEGYGFPDAPIMEVYFRVLPQELWPNQKQPLIL